MRVSLSSAFPSPCVAISANSAACFRRVWHIITIPCRVITALFFCIIGKGNAEAIRDAFTLAPQFPKRAAHFSIDPNAFPHHITHQNKLGAYEELTQDQPSLGDPIEFSRFTLHSRFDVSECPLFSMSSHKPRIRSIPGVIPYRDSTDTCTHWFANFADSHVMGYCEGPLYAQDEDQVLRHPALYHIKTALQKLRLAHMNQREVYLLQNVPCLGELDLEDLYGNQFAQADLDEVLSALTVSDSPSLSNIFYIAAPHIPPRLAGKPYQKRHLEDLFYTAYTAFYAAAQSSDPEKECRIHTGNWGAGAFGNSVKVAHLLQIAAAYAAGVDVDFYPLEEDDAFTSARELFKSIRKEYPAMSVDQFLNHLTANARKFELFYGQGNGT